MSFLLITPVFSQDTTAKNNSQYEKDKNFAIQLGLIFKGMTEEELLKAQGYPRKIFKYKIYKIWYYPVIYNAIYGASKPFKGVYIFFKDNEVVDVKLGGFEVDKCEEI